MTPTGGASRGAAGERGFADVWWRGKFAWEYKRKDKYRDLTEAYRQLCQYREALENPPLLIVSDIARTEIHTNFTGTAKQVHTIALADVAEPRAIDLLRRVFTDPLSLKPDVTAARLTEDVAKQFGTLAQSLRSRGHEAHMAAHFLMKCMFCLFAEDVGLLPGSLFTKLLEHHRNDPAKLIDRLTELFATMRTGGDFGVESVAHFNGSLFNEAPALHLTPADIDTLLAAARSDWGSVEPAIFGTLFERSLDPNTRAQIGAHYTSREDIMLVVEPVVMGPLRREWEAVKAEGEKQLEKRRAAKTKPTKNKADKAIADALHGFVHRLSTVRILDPACGSGNFLYVAIQQLLHLEKEVITYAARPDIAQGLIPQVRPTQLRGIEINPYAAELAQAVIWIGYLQWMRDNGFTTPRDPILEPLQTIECRDAILEFSPEPPHSCGVVSEPGHSCPVDEPARRERRGSEGRGGTYLLTWTTYGTWIPGDERGFVGRIPDPQDGHVIHNVPGEPYDADEPRLRREALRQRKGPPVQLTHEHARFCAEAFREVCAKYGFAIHAGAIMANHVHLVVASEEAEGARLLNLFKGVSSRRLGQQFGARESGSWWTTGGSRRLLPEGRAIENAVNYVRNQGNILAAIETPSPSVYAGRSPSPSVYAGRSNTEDQPPAMNGGARARARKEARAGTKQPRRSAKPASWPEADFIIGNPPFLGGNLIRQGLGDEYVEALFFAYDLPNFSDLCCYWFELARRAVERNPRARVGLLATQAIRGGVNRAVLERIKQTSDIFMAWSDRNWILDGAAVHVSIVGFDSGRETERLLNGLPVNEIHSNLATGADTTEAHGLTENGGIVFIGTKKAGSFEVDWQLARQWLADATNPSGQHNAEALRPWTNGKLAISRATPKWIIDFDQQELTESAGYAAPFAYCEKNVHPERLTNKEERAVRLWWQHRRPAMDMKAAVGSLSRFILTPRVAKHRLFVWIARGSQCDDATYVFARTDDYFFGVLHSSIHELWARRMGTQLREAESGFRYTPTTCFETFPLPWVPGTEPRPSPGVHAGRSPRPDVHAGRSNAEDQPPAINGGARGQTDRGAVELHHRISGAARLLNEQRERWLNPPEWIEPIAQAVDAEDDFSDVPEEARALIRQSAIMARAAKDARLKKRTLTNLYNERPMWLKLAHEQLDRAVLAAYAATDPDGKWSEDWARVWVDSGAGQPLSDAHELTELRVDIDQRVLANLLRLNLQRAGAQ